ncbi:MAG TPA: condensation domain-containing protein, partial [Candidatus Kapabacteria bacterium]|nr:condensation domain-containing protein [Candidatus Kapabacteria bacterium]
IHDVLVTAIEDTNNEKFLCAYMVLAQGQNIPAADLKKYLAAELPEVMIPTYFVSLDRFPLTSSGKIDRRALPGPVIETDQNYTAPGNEIEKKLVKTWSEVLHRDEDKISVLANFFELGGHSLKAAALSAKIHKEFDVNIPLVQFFKMMTIRELAQYIQQSEKDPYLEIERTEKKWYYPLSSAQKRLYFLQLLEETGTGYHINQALQLAGKIDVEKLANTFKTIIQRHESFRTSFIMVDEVPVQRIHDEVPFAIEYLNQATDTFPQHGQTRTFIRAFDLAKAPLIRVGLIKTAAEQALLMVDMHHIISDGVSLTLLVKEFLAIYEGRELAPLRLQYKDYASWQIHRQEKLNKQETYWLNELGGEIPVLDIPLDFERPKIQGFTGSTVSFELDIDDTRALNSLALKQGTTLYMVLLAIYNIFLAKITNCEDIIVGTPTAGRLHSGVEQLIGVFINTLALKNVPYGEKCFHSFLAEVKENSLRAFENQEYPYEELVEKLNSERNTGRNPLFDTMFALQNLDFPAIEIPGLKLNVYHYERGTSKLDLTFVAVEMDQRLSFTVEYALCLFKQETVLRFSDYYKKVVSAILANPDAKISEIEIISAKEKEQVLFHFNSTAVDYPQDKTVHQLFIEQAEKTPDHMALVGADSQICPNCLTYRQLNEQSNRVAGLLIEKGVQPDTIVGIMVERSIEMIIGIMGILKSGGAYLPIDPGYPPERIDYMLKDSRARVLNFENLDFEFVSNFGIRISNFNSSNLCYLIYTSGSTGKP